jgi:hypothetical protein
MESTVDCSMKALPGPQIFHESESLLGLSKDEDRPSRDDVELRLCGVETGLVDSCRLTAK